MNRPVFDAHCDTLGLLSDGIDLNSQQTEVTLSGVRQYPKWTQVFAIWLEAEAMDIDKQYRALYERYIQKTTEFHSVLTKRDLQATSPLKSILGVEGGDLLKGDIFRLQTLFDQGVRLMTLTWNTPNELGDTNKTVRSPSGLSPFGKEVVRHMNRLGMAVDVSHLSDRGFWDTIRVTTKPVLASHSNARGVCQHPRNVTDAMFLAIKRTGGGVGINLYPPFLGEAADIQTAIAHILHFLSLGGEDHVGLGMDLDGTGGRLPGGFSTCKDTKALFDALQQAGVSEEIITKIAYTNMERMFAKILPA